MNEQKCEAKQSTWWITITQLLFLFYYFSYSNSLINNNIILIAAFLVLLIEVFLKGVRNNQKMTLCLIIAFVGGIWAFICSYINGSGLGSAVTEVYLLVSVCLFSETKLLPSQRKKVLVRMAIVLFLVLLIFSKPSPYRSCYFPILPYFPDTVKFNPNCVAMLTYFLFLFIFEIIEQTKCSTKRKKFIQFVVMILSMYYIYLTGARTSIISCAVFLGLFWLCKYKSKKLTRFVFFCGLCFSLCIVFIYIGMFSSGFMVGETFGGKGLYTGRQAIWAEALELFRDNWLFGISNKTTFGSDKFLSTHNSLLAILCYFGVFGVLFTVAVLFISFKRIEYRKNTLIVSAIFSALIVMCFETVITDWSLLLPFCLLFIQMRSGECVNYDT